MDRINAIADQRGIPVIEDAAQSFGATYRGRKSCGLSVIGSTSFFPSKPLGCYGDGGALFTTDDRFAELFRQIRVHGQKKKHHHDVIGINGRMDTLQAAVVLAKLDVFDSECEARVRCAERYTSLILEKRRRWKASKTELNRRIKPPTIATGNTSVFAQYTITSDFNEPIRAYLQSHGIPSVCYYAVPLHLQPAFATLGYSRTSFPIAEAVASRGLSLPMSPGLTEKDQSRIVDLIFLAIEKELLSSPESR
jgi:UDP-2-acetamido-2-deoxy-ribo-hexuluronate aminotransferase